MIPSWKNYGGIGNYEKSNHVYFNSVTTDNLTLRNAYVGFFTISGELFVSQHTTLASNCVVQGTHTVYRDCDVHGTTSLRSDLDVSGDTTLWGNLNLMSNFDIAGNLKIDGTSFQLHRMSPKTDEYYLSFLSSGSNLGINTIPHATLDISSNQELGVQISTTSTTMKNVFQNSSGSATQLWVDSSSSAIQFVVDHAVQAQISYQRDDHLIISTANNTFLHSNVSIGHGSGTHSCFEETVVIYDTFSGGYLLSSYEIPSSVYSTGNALTLLSTHPAANTSLHLMNSTSSYGASLVGGTWVHDPSRSYSSWGVVDLCGNYVPTISQIAGSSMMSRSSVGINTFLPEYDDYVLSVNGPTHLTNGEIMVVQDVSYEIHKCISCTRHPSLLLALGSPYGNFPVAGVQCYQRDILCSTNGGTSWSPSTFINAGDFHYTHSMYPFYDYLWLYLWHSMCRSCWTKWIVAGFV